MGNTSEIKDRLESLAGNLYWSWSRSTHAPFMSANKSVWKETRSPWRVLKETSDEKWAELASDKSFQKKLAEAEEALGEYMESENTWHNEQGSPLAGGKVAYFCAEFGLHESFPIYSGGLGILAGDHMKTASDMGLPMVGVGLLYRCGYVTQQVDGSGWQQDRFDSLEPSDLPLTPALNAEGQPIVVHVPIADRRVYAAVFKAQVGRIPVYLLDTDVDANLPDDRNITRHLYGGGVENRIVQEIVLGIGGVRALKAAGEPITGYHMNEGHAAFLGLELALCEIHNEQIGLMQALRRIASKCAFTTHTPVDAGHDRFSPELVLRNLGPYVRRYRLTDMDLLSSGRDVSGDMNAPFNMTHLALHSSTQRNGVSQLHGSISREMFKGLWPEKAVEDVPITGITNGTHIHSWLSKPMREALACIAGKEWSLKLLEKDAWDNLEKLENDTLLSCHKISKKGLLSLIQSREERRWERVGQPEKALPPLDPNVLTIGFARRFAPYKRATLILRDKERLLKILNNPECPVQLIFAGKCHPANEVGKGLLQELDHLSRDPAYNGRIRFVEGYDMELGRGLVSGVDVWMNTPRRPREASGTSGMKAAMNGIPSLSILDGWWCEGFNDKNGWAFGMTEAEADVHHRDQVDGLALYETLENKVIPLYYQDKNGGTSSDWVSVMKESIKVGVRDFNTERMLKEYVEQMYAPLY